MLQVARDLISLRESLLAFAREHLETLMPGYTHTQPAQPTTMAHYIAGILACLQRDFGPRLRFAYATNNQSPLGAAALTGTAFPIDRELSARLLGFDEIQLSTYDSIGASDNMTDVAGALSTLGVNLSRFTKDMLFWATQESGAIRIDESFLQISSIMPQKRNPVVLEHLRARISRMLAQAQAGHAAMSQYPLRRHAGHRGRNHPAAVWLAGNGGRNLAALRRCDRYAGRKCRTFAPARHNRFHDRD